MFNHHKINFQDPKLNPPPITSKVTSPRKIRLLKPVIDNPQGGQVLQEVEKDKSKRFVFVRSDLRHKKFLNDTKVREIMFDNDLNLEDRKLKLREERSKARDDYKTNMIWLNNLEKNHETLTFSDYARIRKLKNEYTQDYYVKFESVSDALTHVKHEIEKNQSTAGGSSRNPSRNSEVFDPSDFINGLNFRDLSRMYNVMENEAPAEEKHNFINTEPSSEYISEINTLTISPESECLTKEQEQDVQDILKNVVKKVLD